MKTKILLFFLALLLILALFTGCATKNSTTPADTPADIPADTPADTPAAGAYEEGVSAADDIVNTSAADKVILVVSFGTSFNQSRSLTIGGIEAAIREAYPDYQIRRAFTSQIIIDKLAARDNLRIDNVTEAMSRLVLDKVQEVIIQPTTVLNGYEYNDMLDEVMPFADKFASFKIGKYLMNDDIDYDKVAEIMVNVTSQYRADDTAIVWMGHGTEHEAHVIYTNLQNILTAKGYDDYVIGTVEHGIEIDEVQKILATMNVKKVVLRPLMIVAGDHANNDMAGTEEDSWKIILEEDGYEVITVIEGLGQLKDIQDIFVKHVQDAITTDSLDVTPVAYATGVTAARIKNGTYSIDVSSSTSMFKIVDCQLTVADNSMTAVMTLSGQGFGKIYLGTGEQALNDTEDHFYNYTDNGERHAFTVLVSALDKEFDCAGFSIRKEQWYDHIVVFKSANIPETAFVPCQVDVSLSGGSGKATIQSPTELTYREGVNYAKITWSSPNYIYMLVEGEEYLPVNSEGNSAFIIPVVLDKDIKVTACTVAMSEPKEIEYTLNFASESIR